MSFSRNREAPNEPFKRALTATMRAMAQDGELQVSYGPEAPGLRGEQARLPAPSRDLPAEEVRQLRGQADSFALRKRHHDEKTHARLMPQGGTARAVFDTIEQARVEAIGARRMAGVADNLRALLHARCETSGFAKMMDRSEAPLSEVLGLMVREKLTGEPCVRWPPCESSIPSTESPVSSMLK